MKKVLFLSNHFITLYAFRKELINRLVEEGQQVYLSLPPSMDNSYFESIGCYVIETDVDRRGINPIKDVGLIFRYFKLIKDINPDIIFSYTVKPNIYGSLVSRWTKHVQVCNITGTGATFLRKNLVSYIAKLLYRNSIRKAHKVFFQNTGDLSYFQENQLVGSNYQLIPGSGVNLQQYKWEELPEDNVINFIFIGRIMKVKGIDEYLECAKVIKSKYPNTCFYVAGFIEEETYRPVIENYHAAGFIQYLGYQKDIVPWIRRIHVTVLPSHGGEGVPNVLLETAAMGRICIASDINGSRDVVTDGINGFLFEKGNSERLIKEVSKIIHMTRADRAAMGLAGRNKVEKEFNREIVIQAYLAEVKCTNRRTQ